MESFYNNFGVRVPSWTPIVFGFTQDHPALLDGADLFEAACPVNPLTGHRDNPLSILRYALTPKNERLLDVILAELPVVREMDASDDVKLQTLASRLDVGTFAENDFVMKRLSVISDVLFENNPEIKQEVNQNIEFDKMDNPEVSE